MVVLLVDIVVETFSTHLYLLPCSPKPIINQQIYDDLMCSHIINNPVFVRQKRHFPHECDTFLYFLGEQKLTFCRTFV